MILANLNDSARYENLHPLFKRLFDYIKNHDLRQVPAERIVLEGEKLYINVADVKLKQAEEQKLEVHRRYIDIHFPLSGSETCGWTALNRITQDSESPFNTEEDYALYDLPAETYFTAQVGQFYILFPEDAHAPIIGEGSLRKLIAKIEI
ncbi:MAG: YhcH/YjgK/YiaL family protein [Bacteroidales bacterium]|nr:YhcH/YjgK/YiaL family protein [Bacteroidales bacterium]